MGQKFSKMQDGNMGSPHHLTVACVSLQDGSRGCVNRKVKQNKTKIMMLCPFAISVHVMLFLCSFQNYNIM